MKTYKAGRYILFDEFLKMPNALFYIVPLSKVMHYEAIISLPLRIVLKWISVGNIREAVKMSPIEAKREHDRIAKTRAEWLERIEKLPVNYFDNTIIK